MRIPPTFPGERRADMAGAADGIYMHPRAAERLRDVAVPDPRSGVGSELRSIPIFERESMPSDVWAIIFAGDLVATGTLPAIEDEELTDE